MKRERAKVRTKSPGTSRTDVLQLLLQRIEREDRHRERMLEIELERHEENQNRTERLYEMFAHLGPQIIALATGRPLQISREPSSRLQAMASAFMTSLAPDQMKLLVQVLLPAQIEALQSMLEEVGIKASVNHSDAPSGGKPD